MEVVVIAISEEHEGPNKVDNGFRTDRSLAHPEHLCQLLWRDFDSETTHAWQMDSSQSNGLDIFLAVPFLSRRRRVLAVASRKS